MKDVEILLRGFAMLIDGKNYAPSMVKFLNEFSRKCKGHSDEQNEFLSSLLDSFINACSTLPDNGFLNKKTGRFNVALYEAAFAAVCAKPFLEKRTILEKVPTEQLAQLETDQSFINATLEGTTQTKNVKSRLDSAITALGTF